MNLDDEALDPPPGDMPVMRGSKMNVSAPFEPEVVPELPDYLRGDAVPPNFGGGGGDPMPF